MSPSDAAGGVGLRNTAARLAHLYGAAAHLTVAPATGGGTEAVVRLPLHTVPVQPARMLDALDG
jgi:sensor histidine kinase YesM